MIALDLFAGTGWGVACRRLGIEEYGVELMPEAVATREANGMRTLYRDVWEGLEGKHPVPEHGLLIASPPCQTFSMAGGGKGREALDEVVGLIDAKAYLDVRDLRAFGEKHDMRTALVLTPLAHIARDIPMYVVLEQVPPVLPVWERYAVELRKWGYSAVTGILNAEQYGVPQTRRRAILIARADGIEARMPTPTHSRYYSRDPQRLDPGVLPWVSMAEALGWGRTARPSVTVTGGGTETGGAEPLGHLAREVAAPDWVSRRAMLSNYSTGSATGGVELEGNRLPRVVREGSAPALAVTSNIGKNRWVFAGAGATAEKTAGQVPRELDEPAHTVTGAATATFRTADDADRQRVTLEEAAALQSYPEGFKWEGNAGKRFLQVGNAVPPLLAEAILSTLVTAPADTPSEPALASVNG